MIASLNVNDVTVAVELSDDPDLCREAVDSVLSQAGVTLDLLLIGSNKKLAASLCSDSRFRFFETEKPLAFGELLQMLAQTSTATFILSLAANKQMLPGALATLVRELRSDPACDMVYLPQFVADLEGHIHREAFHAEWERARLLSRFDPTRLEDLLNCDFMPDGIRIFRRKSLLSKIPAEFRRHNLFVLFCILHTGLNSRLLRQPLSISKEPNPLKRPEYGQPGNYLVRTLSLLANQPYPVRQYAYWEVLFEGLRNYIKHGSAGRWVRAGWKKVHQWRSAFWPGFSWYRLLEVLLRKMPLIDPRRDPAIAPGLKSVGYYIWQYPVRSQTFVQREVAALNRLGCRIVVFSEIEPEHEFVTALKPVLADTLQPMPVIDQDRLKELKQRFFRKYPVRYLCTYLFVIGCRYHIFKDRRFDRATFACALNLAAQAEMRGIQHLHAPWADRCAFVALIAARLLGISCSVQARAHDIHRGSYTFGLSQKFENVDFVVTNTAYNVGHIRSILRPENAGKLRHIYNGLNLEQFKPAPRNTGKPEIRLLSVGRLVEQKGMEILLRACRRLLDQGTEFRCDIVGGEEEEGMNVYIRLRRLHRELGLERKVNFVGSVPFDRVLPYLQEADIFVLPCVIAGDGSRDIIPNSVLEAMAMKLPVVSTSITALPEMVDQGKTGFLVPPGDADALAAAIQTLVDSPAQRLEFGEAGRLKVEQMFDSRKNVLVYKRLFTGEAG